MKKGWTTTKLITVGGLAVVRFLARFVIYITILVTTGSLFSGLIALIIAPFFVTFTALVINQFGAVTIFSLLSFITDLPTPSIFPKVVNFIFVPSAGLTVDILFFLLKKRKQWFGFWGGFIFNFVHVLLAVILYFSIGLPGAENVPGFITKPSGVVFTALLVSIMGGAFGMLGYLSYQKIKNTAVVKRIQA